MIISVIQSGFVFLFGGFYLNQSGENIVYKGVILSFNLVWIVIFAVFMGHMPKHMADESNLFWKRGMFNACSEEAVEDGCEDFFRNAKVDQGLNNIIGLFWYPTLIISWLMVFCHLYSVYLWERPFLKKQQRKIRQLIGKPNEKELEGGHYDVMDLSGKNIINRDCDTIKFILKNVLNLNMLNLSDNHVDPYGLETIVDSNCDWRNLEILNLSKNPLGPVGCKVLFKIIQRCNKLRILNLMFINMNEEGFDAILQGMSYTARLDDLSIAGNNIGNGGVKSLAAALADDEKSPCFRNLTRLDLRENDISSDGIIALVNELVKLDNEDVMALEEIELSGNMIGMEGFDALKAYALNSTSVTTVDIRFNAHISKEAKNDFINEWVAAGKVRENLRCFDTEEEDRKEDKK